jgi:hypothetical protein
LPRFSSRASFRLPLRVVLAFWN